MSQPLIEALVEFHKTVPAISKTANAQYGKFADLETVLSTVTPHLIKNDLVISQSFEPSEGIDPILVTRLLHVSGAELVSRLPMILGKSHNPLHSFGASCTYLKRYALLAMLGLTADMDMDGDFADEKPSAKHKLSQSASIEGVSKVDDALPAKERELCLSFIAELKEKNPKGFDEIVSAFRRNFGLASNAKIASHVTSRKHQLWINEQLPKYAT